MSHKDDWTHPPRFLCAKEEIAGDGRSFAASGDGRHFAASEGYEGITKVGEKITIARYEKTGGSLIAEGIVNAT